MGWKKIQNLTIGGGGWRGTIIRYSRVADLEFNARSYFLLVVLLVTPWCWFITLYLLQNHTLLFANPPVDTRRRFNVVTTSYRSWNNAMCLRGHLVLVTCYKLSNNSLQKTIDVNIGCYLCQSLLLKNFYVNNFKRWKINRHFLQKSYVDHCNLLTSHYLLHLFNRDLYRGCLVYMFSLRFSGSKFLTNSRRQFRVRKICVCT